MKKIFNLLFCCLAFSFSSYADCTIENLTISESDCIGPGGFFGQVFTTCESGLWENLEINISSLAGGGMAVVYIDKSSIADENSPTKQIVGNFNVMGVQDIPINVLVNNGEHWVWWVELTNGMTDLCYETSAMPFGDSDDYVHSPRTDEPGDTGNSGSLVSRGIKASSRAGAGPVFQVNIIAAPASIPTMNEWGLVIFGLLILNLSVYTLMRMKHIVELKQES